MLNLDLDAIEREAAEFAVTNSRLAEYVQQLLTEVRAWRNSEKVAGGTMTWSTEYGKDLLVYCHQQPQVVGRVWLSRTKPTMFKWCLNDSDITHEADSWESASKALEEAGRRHYRINA